MPFEHLLRPLALGPAELPCRIVSTAHQTTLVADHLPTDDFVAYHEARARGGVGLIILEAVAVAPSGLLTSHTLGGYLDGMAAGYARVVDAVRPHGTRLFVQLFHGGREQIASAPRAPALSSSALPSRRFHTEPRALRTAEVDALVEGYARCAAVAAAGGLDGVEVSAAHGYLAEQFFDPALNRRADRYAEPARFLLDVLAAIRAAAPGLALGVRFSADSEAARGVVAQVAPLVDVVHVALGRSATYDGCVGIVPPPPVPRNAVAGLVAPFRVGPPLIATSRIVEPDDAERLVATRVAEAVGMNRALITDPELPSKLRRGRVRDVLRCIGCNACIAHYHAETPIRCAQNARTGRERTFARAVVADRARRVVVIGGGPAGLAAAAEAGAAGHAVVLLEREPGLGGQVRLAAAAPAHAELARTLLGNFERLLRSGRVDVRLGRAADPDDVLAEAPDLVVVATGARPYRPALADDGPELVSAWQVLAGRRPAGRVVVADWGGDPSGLACAELLAGEGREVVLASGAAVPGEALHQYQRNAYLGRLARLGVTIVHHQALAALAPGAARFRHLFAPELECELPADAVVLALGRVPEDGLGQRLRAVGLAVEEAGDCRGPRGLEEAVLEGTVAARRLTAYPARVHAHPPEA